MLKLDESDLTNMFQVKEGTLEFWNGDLHVFYNNVWIPVGRSQVKELAWKGVGYYWGATTPVGTFNIGLDNLYDDYELVVVAYDFNNTIIFRGEEPDDQSLSRDIETAKQVCQDMYNELVLACLK